jgi:hypothetical protein
LPQAQRSRRPRLTFIADQPDHSPDRLRALSAEMPTALERNFNTAFTLAPWLCSTVRRPSCFIKNAAEQHERIALESELAAY